MTIKAIKMYKSTFIGTQMHVRGILIHVITCMTDSKQECERENNKHLERSPQDNLEIKAF